MVLNFRPQSDPLTLRLDRAASIIRNTHDGSFELTLTDDDRTEVSGLLEQACNKICSLAAAAR